MGKLLQKLLHSAGTKTIYNLGLPKASIFRFHLLLPQAWTQLFKMDTKTPPAASSEATASAFCVIEMAETQYKQEQENTFECSAFYSFH